jgi:hypothetical protein
MHIDIYADIRTQRFGLRAGLTYDRHSGDGQFAANTPHSAKKGDPRPRTASTEVAAEPTTQILCQKFFHVVGRLVRMATVILLFGLNIPQPGQAVVQLLALSSVELKVHATLAE